MSLPGPRVTAVVEAAIAGVPMRDLRGAAARLFDAYRDGDAPGPLTAVEAAAYAITRAPGTFTAVRRVLGEVRASRPGWSPTTLLDLGAGTGAATLAALEVFPSLEHSVCVESDPQMRALGARLTGDRAVEWREGDARAPGHPAADLVIASYVLAEFPAAVVATAARAWWEVTTGELVLIEPGTPDGTARILACRDATLDAGASVTAPCPHARACPLAVPDWCHFGVRLERSKLQRDVKGADLPFEDERFSYVALSRSAAPSPVARVLEPPMRRGGHVRVHLCEEDGIHRRVLSKRDGGAYQAARASRWGDRLPPTADA